MVSSWEGFQKHFYPGYLANCQAGFQADCQVDFQLTIKATIESHLQMPKDAVGI